MSDKLLQLWESTIAASLVRNIAANPFALPPAKDDTLVKLAAGNQQAIPSNIANYPALGPDKAKDPMVQYEANVPQTITPQYANLIKDPRNLVDLSPNTKGYPDLRGVSKAKDPLLNAPQDLPDISVNTKGYPNLNSVTSQTDPLSKDPRNQPNLGANTQGYPNLAGVSKGSDPLLQNPFKAPMGNVSPPNLGANQAAYPRLDPNTQAVNDPLVVATYQPQVFPGGPKGDSIQVQLAQRKYTNTTTYSTSDPPSAGKKFDPSNPVLPGALLFRDTKVPAYSTFPQGTFDGVNGWEGGSTYAPGSVTSYAPIATKGFGTSLNSGDIIALASYVRNVGRAFGLVDRPGDSPAQKAQSITAGATWAAQNLLLATFNPTDPQNGGILNAVWNPLSLPSTMIPLVMRGNAISSPNSPAVLSLDGKVYSTNVAALGKEFDRHLLMRSGDYVKTPNASDILQGRLINYPGYLGDIAVSQNSVNGIGSAMVIPGVNGVSIDGQVDQEGTMGQLALMGNYQTNVYTYQTPYNANGFSPIMDQDYIEQALIDNPDLTGDKIALQALFKPSSISPIPSLSNPLALLGANNVGPSSYQFYWKKNPGKAYRNTTTKPGSYPADYDVNFGEEGADGTIPISQVNSDDTLKDDSQYMPFTFQDLRQNPPALLFFRAFLKDGINEQFQPNWQSEGYYGRVDQVATYVNTQRTISLAFDVVAWAPADLNPMWTKLTKLQSMVYPSYDANRFLQAGPLIRLRIGDLFACEPNGDTVKRGLPGYISSLNFSYDDGIWNVRTDFKIPRKVNVQMTFVVLHDGNPGTYNDSTGAGVFGTLEFKDAPTDTGTPNPSGIRGIVGTIANSTDGPTGVTGVSSVEDALA